ncbi:MAG TPA: c-type cytochrome [Gaiella sp.]|jgi:cytochrome c1
MRRVALAPAAAAALALVLGGCGGSNTEAVTVPGADPGSAPTVMKAFGCGSCHTIPGVDGANGRVGPSLAHIGERWSIAGRLPNTPPNLVRWIVHPQEVDPGTLMPDLGVAPQQARDIAAYLYRH